MFAMKTLHVLRDFALTILAQYCTYVVLIKGYQDRNMYQCLSSLP